MKKILITCNHLKTSESITIFVNSKYGRLFSHYRDIIRIRIELKLDSGNSNGKRFLARAIIEQRGPDIVAVSESDNAYAALDATLRKTERQLRRRVRLARFKREQMINRMRGSSSIPSTLIKQARV